jgi:hypothetical protein
MAIGHRKRLKINGMVISSQTTISCYQTSLVHLCLWFFPTLGYLPCLQQTWQLELEIFKLSLINQFEGVS